MKHLAILIALLFVPGIYSASAEDSRLSKLDQGAVAAARELVKLCDMKTTVEVTYHSALDTEVEHFRKLGLSGAHIEEIKNVMLDFFKEALPYAELEPEFVRFYATKFTEAELKEVIAFAKTPTGKKTLKLSAGILSSGVKAGQKRVHARLNELEARIMPIVEKGIMEKNAKE